MPMTRRAPWTAALLTLAFVLAAAPAASAATDDTIPGDDLASAGTPVAGSLDAQAADAQDIYSVTVGAGETLSLSLSSDPALLTDFDLFVYGPGTVIAEHSSAIASAVLPLYYPETINYTVATGGTYYVEAFASEGAGPYTLAWSVLPEPQLPVYRFYNVRTGTHFYTPSDAERNTVVNTLGDTYRYEGVAYTTRATRNTQPLYRFYNRRAGSHFYTADPTERDRVINTLGYIYTYDGPTYKVSPANDGTKAPVWRFYDRRTGSHFYTADATERDRVITTLGYIYTFEGAAFYLGQ